MSILKNAGRDELAKLFHGVGVEVGVEQGKYSEVICQSNINVKLYCVDAWKPYKAYVDHRREDKLKLFHWRTVKRMKPYNATIIRKFSMDAVKDFEDCSLDFVYIDANHSYKHVTEDITEWSKKIKPGGIVSGHDYIDHWSRGETYRVKPAVDDYVKNNNIDELFVYNTDEFPSWMFIKK